MPGANIVVGLGWGDEGKGLVTDYLCSKAKNPLVIRFNGGQQAGHTVCLPDGRRHVFSNFGAGTLREASTYWSAYCTCAVPNILKEYQALLKSGIAPKLYLDEACPVTTHYDVLYNQLLEQQRNNNRHGSCGMGFGTTLQRQLDQVSFTAGDLVNPDARKQKLAVIRKHYQTKAASELTVSFNDFDHDSADARFIEQVNIFHQLLGSAFFITNEAAMFANPDWEAYVFEGAQGILLDMDWGKFPHVTRSNTTSNNALEIISRNKNAIADVTINCVSRCYHTRHGEGPFVPQSPQFGLHNNADETNIFNPHQGNFRTAPLNIDQVNHALRAEYAVSGLIPKNLFLTCADQVDKSNILYTASDALHTTDIYHLPALFQSTFQQMLLSNSPYAAGINTLPFRTT